MVTFSKVKGLEDSGKRMGKERREGKETKTLGERKGFPDYLDEETEDRGP